MVRGRISRAEHNRTLELPFRGVEFPVVVHLHETKRRVGIGQGLVERERLLRRFARPRHRVVARKHVVGRGPEQRVRVGQSRVRFRVIRIQRECLLEEHDCTLMPISSALVPEEPSLQIVFECLGIDRCGAAEARALLRRQLQADLLRDGARDVALHAEDVPQVAVVVLSPDVSLIANLDELRRDAHASGVATHAALEEVVHAQLASNLPGVLRCIPVLHGR